MKNGYSVFVEEFSSYVLLNYNGEELSFGNMSFDYSVSSVGGRYILSIYSVVLDHYGMPMRNPLSCERFDISDIFIDKV